MTKRTMWQRVRTIGLIGGMMVMVGVAAWCVIAYSATAEAKSQAKSDARVTVIEAEDVVFFSSTASREMNRTGLAFFPGAGVDPMAYAPLARAVAIAGFPVTIVPMPWRGLFGGATSPKLLERAITALNSDNRADKWVIAGHSRGAEVAARLVRNMLALGAGNVGGLLLIGTSHPREIDLSRSTLPVTKIFGTRDGIATVEKVEANRIMLPKSTRWIPIEGGNHSQFGWYGFQPGDRSATISKEAQHQQLIDGVLATLRAASDAGANQPFGPAPVPRKDPIPSAP